MRRLIHKIRHVRSCYATIHGRAPNLLNPMRYSEKIQWRKLFDHNPAYTTLSDKLAVRGFIASRAGPDYLIPLLWSGLPANIPFASLTSPYVLKSNHASGQVMHIDPQAKIDHAAIRATAAAWLATPYGITHDEPGYTGIPPRLLAEPRLLHNGTAPEELRLFVFHGKTAIINTVFIENGQVRNGAFHTADWTRLDWYFTRHLTRSFPAPEKLADMIRIAEQIGTGFDHVRVDIYDCGDKFFVGEITLYPWSGLARFTPDEADKTLGTHWHLPHPRRRALWAIMTGKTAK